LCVLAPFVHTQSAVDAAGQPCTHRVSPTALYVLPVCCWRRLRLRACHASSRRCCCAVRHAGHTHTHTHTHTHVHCPQAESKKKQPQRVDYESLFESEPKRSEDDWFIGITAMDLNDDSVPHHKRRAAAGKCCVMRGGGLWRAFGAPTLRGLCFACLRALTPSRAARSCPPQKQQRQRRRPQQRQHRRRQQQQQLEGMAWTPAMPCLCAAGSCRSTRCVLRARQCELQW
jgi:hypothetical protein